MTRLEASSGLTKVLPPNKITFLSEFSCDLYCRELLDGSSLSSAPKVSTLILLWETRMTSISIPRLVWSVFLAVFYFFDCVMAFKCTVHSVFSMLLYNTVLSRIIGLYIISPINVDFNMLLTNFQAGHSMTQIFYFSTIISRNRMNAPGVGAVHLQVTLAKRGTLPR